MKTLSYLCAITIISVALSYCSHQMAPEGHYQDSNVVVDGSISDWRLPLRFSNQQYSFQYSVTNDNKNIYVVVYTRDLSTQLRILKAGMNIYFDPKGEKNKNISIAFPIKKVTDQNNYRNGDPVRNTDNKAMEDQLLLQSDYFNLTGFTNMENGQYGIEDNKTPVKLVLKVNADSSMVYEVSVPIKNVLGSDLNPKTASKNFSVGVVINAITSTSRNTSNNYRPSYGGMHGMHAGGMYGGGMGGGGYRRNNNPSANNAGSKEDANWYQFRLAYKKG